MDIGYPDLDSQPLSGRKNVANAILALAVPLPAIICAVWLFGWFGAGPIPPASSWAEVETTDALAAYLLRHPILAANLFYFLFVDLVFFGIALAQRSSWLIDPYWTLLPPLIAAFFLAHPLADPNWGRVALAWTPLLIWSSRLTHNYFRREGWRFGLREDWRYAKMRRERPWFWLEQFFVVHLVQHGMLVGLSLPFYSVAFRPDPLGPFDALFSVLSIGGILIAGIADDQLDRFMRANEDRVRRGEPKIAVLDTGIWRYSRHPNYFGEQLFWWSIAGFGVALGDPWVVAGTAFNSAVLAGVTIMTERRMMEVPSRAKAYADYRARTSVWVPWPPRPSAAEL